MSRNSKSQRQIIWFLTLPLKIEFCTLPEKTDDFLISALGHLFGLLVLPLVRGGLFVPVFPRRLRRQVVGAQVRQTRRLLGVVVTLMIWIHF